MRLPLVFLSFALFGASAIQSAPVIDRDTQIAVNAKNLHDLDQNSLCNVISFLEPSDLQNFLISDIKLSSALNDCPESTLVDFFSRAAPEDRELFFLKAIRYNETKIIDLLTQNDLVNLTIRDNSALYLAARSGHVNLVDRFLRDLAVNSAYDPTEAMKLAARYGQSSVLKYFLDRLPRFLRADESFVLIEAASNSKDAETIITLYSSLKFVKNGKDFLHVARSGSPDAIRFVMRKNRNPDLKVYYQEVLRILAHRGLFEAYKVALGEMLIAGIPASILQDSARFALENKHRDIVHYLVSEARFMVPSVLVVAAELGDLDLLKSLDLERGDSFELLQAAVFHNQPRIFEYLKSQFTNLDEQTALLLELNDAITSGEWDKELVKSAQSDDRLLEFEFLRALQVGQIDFVRQNIRQIKDEWLTKISEIVVKAGQLNSVKFLQQLPSYERIDRANFNPCRFGIHVGLDGLPPRHLQFPALFSAIEYNQTEIFHYIVDAMDVEESFNLHILKSALAAASYFRNQEMMRKIQSKIGFETYSSSISALILKISLHQNKTDLLETFLREIPGLQFTGESALDKVLPTGDSRFIRVMSQLNDRFASLFEGIEVADEDPIDLRIRVRDLMNFYSARSCAVMQNRAIRHGKFEIASYIGSQTESNAATFARLQALNQQLGAAFNGVHDEFEQENAENQVVHVVQENAPNQVDEMVQEIN
jgi:hypothetical protein